MSKLKIIQYGNPILEQPSVEVLDPKSEEISTLIEKMMIAMNKHGEGAAGISAPQIGILHRVAICRRVDLEKNNKIKAKDIIWEVMINPKIIQQSEIQSTRWEGCLSINFGDLFGKVTRPKTVTIEFLDLNGNRKELSATDYFSHVIQHEIDHLNGVLFLKYIPNPEDLYTGEELLDIDN